MALTETDAQGTLGRVESLCDLGRYGDAVELVGEVISEDPRQPAAWCLMARAQLGRGNAAAALKAAQAAQSLSPDHSWPYRLESTALAELGRHEQAVVAAREATRCSPSSWQGYARLAHCLSALRGRHNEAEAAANRALGLRPDHPGPHLAAGAVAAAAGRIRDAAAEFSAALAIDPQNTDAHNALAALRPHRSKLRSGGASRVARTASGRVAEILRAAPSTQVSARD
jgi:tetratricopeptide (TPR) repeat protein